MISVQLNSFVHRVHDKHQFTSLASNVGCELKRIRRSRHWLLSGSEQQLSQLRAELSIEHNLWIKKAIEKALPEKQISLNYLIQSNPAITVNQLLEMSGCTVAQARLAIDEFEAFD